MYISRFRQFLVVNDIKEQMHSAVFITVMGDAHYHLSAATNLLAPDNPFSKLLDNLVKILQAHFKPQVLVVAERQKFYARRQGEEVWHHLLQI